MRTLSPDKDAYVDAGSPDTNFGSSNELFIRWQDPVIGGNDRETWISIDLSPVLDDPDVLDIVAATLRIPVQDNTGSASTDLHEANETWDESTLTWNNKPDGDLDAFGGDVSDAPHEWDVTDEIDSKFSLDVDRVDWFVVVDPHGGTALEASAEYDSREAGTGEEPELEIETTEQRRDDLDSQVQVSKSGAADLSSFVEAKFRGGRWESAEKTSFVDAGGNAYDLGDIAWDTDRTQFWTTEVFAGAIIHRHDRDGSHDVTFDVVEDGSKLDDDLTAVAVVDGGNVFVGTSGDAETTGEGDVLECSVDEDADELVVQQRNTAHDANPAWLTFDGTRVWILEFFDGKVEERHPDNWALNRSGSIGSGDAYRGIGRASDHNRLLLWKDTAGELQEQDPDDLGTVQKSHDRDDVITTGQGIAFLDRSWFGTLFIGESGGTGSEYWALSPVEIDSQVRPSGIPRDADLSSTVTPGSVPDHADLSSSVSTGAEADLSSTATPRVDGSADLSSTVQPGSLARSDDLSSVVEVQAVPIDDSHEARTEGRVAPTIVVDEADMADISGEVGTAITVDGDDLRRVVQVLDSSNDWPRARADPATTLHRGDAVLYAQSGDEFAVGDVVEWGDRSWEVVGFLGWETIGDSRLYQEIGLRRLATTHEARTKATVQRTAHVDLYSEMEANVP